MKKESWKLIGLGGALIVLLAVVAYIPALRGGFIWDDDSYVTENQALRTIDGLWKIWTEPVATPQYYPVAFTSFWLEYHLWRLQPFGYHLVNVLLHALNAVLLWRVLRRLEISGAWCAAAVFAIHPVEVESVAWITERKNVLSGTFYLMALLAYFRFRSLTGEKATIAFDWRFYPLVIVLFLCALLSKTVTCSLPAVIVLLTWWKSGRVEKRDFLALLPLFVLGTAMGGMTAWLEKHRVGASGAEWALSGVERCLVAGRALWFYAGKLFWPRKLTFIYPRWKIDAGTWWQYLFPSAAVIVLIVMSWLRRRIGTAPLVATLFFVGTLAPALGFFDVYPFRYSFVADHFQYLACVGPIALAVSACAAICRRVGQLGRDLGMLATVAVLVIFGGSTWGQAHIYRDQETLWRDTLTKNPGAWMAHDNWGVVLCQQGKVPEAIAQYEQALRLKPDSAGTHNNLGIALFQQGRVPKAIAQYEQALQIKPDYAEAHNNLGAALLHQGRVTEAIAHYEQALRIRPDHARAHNNLGAALAQVDRVQEAIGQFEQALRLNPDFTEAHYNLGVALAQVGRVQEAIGQFEQALRLNPDFAEAQNKLVQLRAVQ